MKDDKANRLPIITKKRFKVLYSEYRAAGITTFKSTTGKWGAILNDYHLLIPATLDSIYYNIDYKHFEGVVFHQEPHEQNRTYLFFDQKGIRLAQFEAFNYCVIDEFGCYRCQHQLRSAQRLARSSSQNQRQDQQRFRF